MAQIPDSTMDVRVRYPTSWATWAMLAVMLVVSLSVAWSGRRSAARDAAWTARMAADDSADALACRQLWARAKWPADTAHALAVRCPYPEVR